MATLYYAILYHGLVYSAMAYRHPRWHSMAWCYITIYGIRLFSAICPSREPLYGYYSQYSANRVLIGTNRDQYMPKNGPNTGALEGRCRAMPVDGPKNSQKWPKNHRSRGQF